MEKHVLGSAIAGGAIATALLETLFDKGILTLDESRTVLDRAIRAIGPFAHAEGAFEAQRIIGGLQVGRFNARGTAP
jgi:hypothetical protein